MAAYRTERSSRGTGRGGNDVNPASGYFNKEPIRLPYDAPYSNRKRYANTKPRLLKQEEMRQQELREQLQASAELAQDGAPPIDHEGGGQGEHAGGGSEDASGTDAPSRCELPTATPRRKAGQRPQCRLVHVDPTDCDTMYLLSQRERLCRLDPKRKSMAMKKIQEVMHEIEFGTAASPTEPARE